jgi:hypothetical protein
LKVLNVGWRLSSSSVKTTTVALHNKSVAPAAIVKGALRSALHLLGVVDLRSSLCIWTKVIKAILVFVKLIATTTTMTTTTTKVSVVTAVHQLCICRDTALCVLIVKSAYSLPIFSGILSCAYMRPSRFPSLSLLLLLLVLLLLLLLLMLLLLPVILLLLLVSTSVVLMLLLLILHV